MKKIRLLTTLLTAGVLLSGCNCNCDVSNDCNSLKEESNEAKKICLENKGTYSRITAPDEEHGECMFPSGIGCRDEMIIEGECNRKADTQDIDTEEERFEKCKGNVTGWFDDMVENSVLNNVEYAEEQEQKDDEGNLSMITRDFKAYYTKDGENWIISGTCEADFVRGGLGTTYHEEYKEE